MSYIGRGISNLSDRTVLDSITASATATYNLLLNTVAYVPSSAESLTVSLNGVIQAPQNSYTVSGSTIVFASSLASTDSIDFILAERAITLTTIGSGTVTTSNIVDGNVTNAKLANSAITLNGSAVSLGGSATIGGGKIGQVVSAVYDTVGTSTSSSSFVAMGLSVAITPSATSSKILVQVSGGSVYTANDKNGWITIYRDSTNLGNTNGFQGHFANSSYLLGALSMSTLDSPSSTSAITYAVYIKTTSGPVGFQDSATRTVITAMEVLA
mgnify:FL=1